MAYERMSATHEGSWKQTSMPGSSLNFRVVTRKATPTLPSTGPPGSVPVVTGAGSQHPAQPRPPCRWLLQMAGEHCCLLSWGQRSRKPLPSGSACGRSLCRVNSVGCALEVSHQTELEPRLSSASSPAHNPGSPCSGPRAHGRA